MLNNNESAIEVLAEQMKKRDNPKDLKTAIIGKVVKLEPLTVAIDNELIYLIEGKHLEISEWFRFRCKLNKNSIESGMKETVSSNTENLIGTCSANGCNLSTVTSNLIKAIQAISSELYSLKCELEVGDFVAIASLEENGKYVLLDKVL